MNRKSAAQKAKRRFSLVNLIGGLLLGVAGVFTALLFFANSPVLQDWYGAYQLRVELIENYVLDLPDVWLILLVVLLLYALKSWLPLPIPMMCFITGVVLPQMYMSFAVNITGLTILFTIRYLWGRKRGGGGVKKIIDLNRNARRFLERDSASKFWLLFLFRLVPNFPVNSVSQLFGAMGFDYADFVLISLLGFLPKLISYTMLGKNLTRPLSGPFLIPLVIIFTLSGISTIGINLALNRRQKEE